MKWLVCVLVLLSSFCLAQTSTKPIALYVDGDSSTLPKFMEVCNEKGSEFGMAFRFVQRQSDEYDYHVVLSSEGMSAWDFAHGNIVVMNKDSKVLFTVTRANRWTGKGATSALSKEFLKVMARYLGTKA